MLGILLLLQTAPTPQCSDGALCRLLQDAEAVNRRAMLAAGGYSATVETESAMLGRREGRMEAPTLIEQTSGQARWLGDGGLSFHVAGSRSFTNAIPLSRLAFLRMGWMVPTLAATRLQVITDNGNTGRSETLQGALAPQIVVHPLAEDREKFYTYSGGSRVRRRIDLAEREVLAVEVLPRPDIDGEETIFEGEMQLDPDSHALVRLLGRFRIVGRPKRKAGMLRLPHFEPGNTLVDLINQRLPNGDWVPQSQRFEVQTASSLTSGSGGARRVISRFYSVEAIPAPRNAGGIGASTMGYAVTRAQRDSLRGFHGWHTRAGQATASVASADFSRYRPGRLQTTGGPIFLIQGLEHGEFLRVNRIEGVFTGLSGIVRLRDPAPGFFLHADGGYAWKEKTFRGGGDLGWESPNWTVAGGAARTLDVTNKFRNQFDNPSLGALVGRDSWDYLDRRGGGGEITRLLDPARGSIVKLEFARMNDRSVTPHIHKSLIGSKLRINRNITEGSYWRSKATLDWNPTVSPIFSRDGIGLRAEVENGNGDLDYTRVEARLVLRKTFTSLFFIARLHAGAVISDQPPPQQLFELGGAAQLPGYDYKEFAGDRAVLFRTRLTYPLPMLDVPLHIGSAITLPSFSPALSVGFQGGITGTRNAGGVDAVRALGDKYDEKTGLLVTDPVTGLPLPASTVADKLRTSIDIRIGFFGDALAVGIAKGLERGRKMRFIFAFGRQF